MKTLEAELEVASVFWGRARLGKIPLPLSRGGRVSQTPTKQENAEVLKGEHKTGGLHSELKMLLLHFINTVPLFPIHPVPGSLKIQLGDPPPPAAFLCVV